VGDILRLQENDEIPCDLVLLSSSDPLGNCFIQVHWKRLG
jgi:magnesium-transporting ATPase (P-type)